MRTPWTGANAAITFAVGRLNPLDTWPPPPDDQGVTAVAALAPVAAPVASMRSGQARGPVSTLGCEDVRREVQQRTEEG